MKIKINTLAPYIIGKFGLFGKINKIITIHNFTFIEYDDHKNTIKAYENAINMLIKQLCITEKEGKYFFKNYNTIVEFDIVE
jgi:hypothetical protein